MLMNRPSRPLTAVRRGVLIAATAGALTFGAAPLASAAAPAPAIPAVVIASPGTGIPILGGLIDSVLGIVTGTIFGIAGAAGAVVCSVTPACVPTAATS